MGFLNLKFPPPSEWDDRDSLLAALRNHGVSEGDVGHFCESAKCILQEFGDPAAPYSVAKVKNMFAKIKGARPLA